MIPQKYAKYIPIALIFLLGVAAAYFLGKNSGQAGTTPSPTPSATATGKPTASPKPTATPISTQGTLNATFTTDAGGPSSQKVAFANRPLTINRQSDGKLILSVMTDKDGKIVVKLDPGNYYITSTEIDYFGKINFSITSGQITYLSKYIPNPKIKGFN